MPAWSPSPLLGPPWLSTWAYRAPLSYTVGGVQNNQCIDYTIPQSWDRFWTAVLSNGNDVRLTQADGFTEIPRVLNAWNATSRTGSIRAGGLDAGGTTGVGILWIYWGNSGAGSPPTGSPSQTNVRPSRVWRHGMAQLDPVLLPPTRSAAAAAARPTWIVQQLAEKRVVWCDVTDLLAPRIGAIGTEGLKRVLASCTGTEGEILPVAEVALVEAPNGRLVLRLLTSPPASTAADTLLATITLHTDTGALVEVRADIVLT